MSNPTTTSVYGRILPNTSKNLVTSKLNKTTGFKYPILEEDRSYFTKQSGLELIKNNMRILLKTIRGERFMLPEYGCNLRNYLMEPLDDVTFDLVKEDIQNSIRKYINGVNILKLQVGETPTSNMHVVLLCNLVEENLVKFDTRIEF